MIYYFYLVINHVYYVLRILLIEIKILLSQLMESDNHFILIQVQSFLKKPDHRW